MGLVVIFSLALSDVEYKVRDFEAGDVAYITKPFQQPEVLARGRANLMLSKRKLEIKKALKDTRNVSGILQI